MKLHLWSPELAQGGGGIEVYSSDWLKGLIDLYGDAGIRVFTKNDTTAQLSSQWGNAISVKGAGRVPESLRTPAFVASVVTAAIRDRPDLIVSTHVNFGPAAAWLRRVIGSRYLLTLHGVDVWGLEHKQRQNGIAKTDLIVPISSYTAERVMQEQGIDPDKVRILRCVADTKTFQIGPKPEYLLKRYSLDPGQPVIITVGRLDATERYKGHDRILRILSEVRSQLSEAGGNKSEVRRQISEVSAKKSTSDLGSPTSDFRSPNSDLRYLIVGDGDDRPRLEKLAEELGVREMVIFAGKVPSEELCNHYNLCDVFCMPSTGEGFGIVFLEALACGKPVIAGKKDASRDAVLDGEIGVLVDPDDPQELTQSLVTVLKGVESSRNGCVATAGLSKFKVEGSRPASISQLLSPSSTLKIPEIIFQPEELRQKVIEHFGYEGFKKTLQGYLEEFFPEVR